MKLERYMIEVGLTDSDMAALLEVARATVTRYRSGVLIPQWSTMRKIAEITEGKVMPNDFLSDTMLDGFARQGTPMPSDTEPALT